MIYQRKDLQLSVLLLSSLIITCFSCKNEKKTSEVNQEASKASFTEKPNFLIIIADDAGWNDMSFHGSEIQTPHLDQLAQNGIQLERFYEHK